MAELRTDANPLSFECYQVRRGGFIECRDLDNNSDSSVAALQAGADQPHCPEAYICEATAATAEDGTQVPPTSDA